MSLHHEAAQRWGKRCPCCERVMTPARPVKPGFLMPVNMATRGHDEATGRGGDPNVWVHICWTCNNEQGFLPFSAWAGMLRWKDDPRAANVETLAVFIGQWRLKQQWREAAE